MCEDYMFAYIGFSPLLQKKNIKKEIRKNDAVNHILAPLNRKPNDFHVRIRPKRDYSLLTIYTRTLFCLLNLCKYISHF